MVQVPISKDAGTMRARALDFPRRLAISSRSASLRVSWCVISTSRFGMENRADRCRACQNGSPSHSLSLDVCKTENQTWDKTHGGAGRKARSPSCPKRRFGIHGRWLRPRRKGGWLPVAGPAARRPAGRGHRRGGQPLPRLRFRRTRRPAGTQGLLARPEEGRRARALERDRSSTAPSAAATVERPPAQSRCSPVKM